MLYLFTVLSTVQQTSQLGTVYKESSIIMQFTKEILKWHAVLLGIHAGFSYMKTSECLGVNLRTDSYWWKTNTQSTSCCLWWLLVMVTLCLHSSSHRASDSTWRSTWIAWRDSIAVDWEGGCWKILWLTKGLCTMPHKQENLGLAVKKISVTTLP